MELNRQRSWFRQAATDHQAHTRSIQELRDQPGIGSGRQRGAEGNQQADEAWRAQRNQQREEGSWQQGQNRPNCQQWSDMMAQRHQRFNLGRNPTICPERQQRAEAIVRQACNQGGDAPDDYDEWEREWNENLLNRGRNREVNRANPGYATTNGTEPQIGVRAVPEHIRREQEEQDMRNWETRGREIIQRERERERRGRENETRRVQRDTLVHLETIVNGWLDLMMPAHAELLIGNCIDSGRWRVTYGGAMGPRLHIIGSLDDLPTLPDLDVLIPRPSQAAAANRTFNVRRDPQGEQAEEPGEYAYPVQPRARDAPVIQLSRNQRELDETNESTEVGRNASGAGMGAEEYTVELVTEAEAVEGRGWSDNLQAVANRNGAVRVRGKPATNGISSKEQNALDSEDRYQARRRAEQRRRTTAIPLGNGTEILDEREGNVVTSSPDAATGGAATNDPSGRPVVVIRQSWSVTDDRGNYTGGETNRPTQGAAVGVRRGLWAPNLTLNQAVQLMPVSEDSSSNDGDGDGVRGEREEPDGPESQ